MAARLDGRARHVPEAGLRLVAARRPAPDVGLVRFHPRLTVLTDFGPHVEGWLSGLLDPSRSPDTSVAIEHAQLPVRGAPGSALATARLPVVDLARLQDALADGLDDADAELRARAGSLAERIAELRARQADLARRRARLEQRIDAARAHGGIEEACLDAESAALADELEAIDAALTSCRRPEEIEAELQTWEAVVADAQRRLAAARAEAARPGPDELAAAARLRDEWRYAEQVHREVRRRRSRREADDRRRQYEEFLTMLGATCYEDLAVVGTGFGNTQADVAIREAATVVSMAEQHRAALRAELDDGERSTLDERRARTLARAEAVLGRSAGTDPVGALRAIEPHPLTTLVTSRAAGADVGGDEPANRDTADEMIAARATAADEHDRIAAEIHEVERASGALERARLELADGAQRRVSRLGPLAAEILVVAVLDRVVRDDTGPVVVHDVVSAFDPRSRRPVFEAIAHWSRTRQLVLVTDSDDVVSWATSLPAEQALVWTADQAAAACA